MGKIKILHVIHNLAVGGAEKMLIDLVNLLDKSKFDTHVIIILKDNYLLRKIDTVIKVSIFGAEKKIVDFIRFISFLRHYVELHKIQIVHVHLIYSCIAGIVVKFLYPAIKLVYSPHSVFIQSFLYRIVLKITKFLRDADIIFSNEMQKNYLKSNAVIIPNGIKIHHKQLPKFSVFTFIAVGRLVPVKRHSFLIDCIESLQKKIQKPFQLLIVGDGKLYQKLQNKIIEKNLKNHIQMLGYREDIIELCAQSHVFLMSSSVEGMPISILEAGSCGLPVISTPVGSIPSIIESETGYLAEYNEFPDTMLKVYQNYTVAQQKGNKLKQLIESKYSIEAMVEAYTKFYFGLLYRQVSLN